MYLRTALSKNKATVKDISINNYRDGGIKNHQLSEEIYTFTALEKLYISGDFVSLSPKISNLQQLEHLSIESNLLTELPEEIGTLKNLRYLSIKGNVLSKLPESLSNLVHLKSLSIWRSPNITKLPASISQLPLLTSISIYWGNMTDLTALRHGFKALKEFYITENPLDDQTASPIWELEHLTKLTVTNSFLSNIPQKVLRLKQLQNLVLSNNRLKTIPDFLAQLPKLKVLNFENNQVEKFPVFLAQMPSIQHIGWKDNSFGKYDQALLLFPTNVTNPHTKTNASKQYEHFISRVRKQKFTPKAQKLFFDIQSQHPLKTGAFERSDFLEILSFEDKTFRSTVINQLLDYEKKRFDKNGLSSGDTLVALGKATLPKNEIRSILKENGVNYQTKIDAQTTHILVGNSGITDYSLLSDKEHTLVSQQAFQQYVNTIKKPYLLEQENKNSFDHLSGLLLSQNLENQSLGIELLQGGGTPKELLTELFIVFKFSEDKKIAAKAKKLLSANASKEILEKLKLRINLKIVKDYYKTENKLERLTEGTSLEVWKIAQYAYRYRPKVWAPKVPLGLKNAPKDIAINFLVEVVRAMSSNSYTIEPNLLPHIQLLYQNCTFLKDIKFHRIAQNIDGISSLTQLEKITYYFVKDAHIPNDLYLLPNLKSIRLTQTYSKNWASLLTQLSQITTFKKLSIWHSMETGLHPDISKIQQLEHFVCNRTLLSTQSIAVLAQLPHLKYLNLDTTSEHLDDRYLALENLEALSFHNETIYQVTPRIAEFKYLKSLRLTGALVLPDTIPPMPQLESLFIKTSYHAPSPIQYTQLQNLTHLKKMTINGNVTNLKSMLPHFKHLEYLELSFNNIELQDLITALQQLPKLKKLKRYLSTQELLTLQKAHPHLEILIS